MADTTYAPPADIDARRVARARGRRSSAWWPARIGFVFDRDHFFRSWLIAYLLFLGIALGSMALLMIQHLSGGAWGVFRRIFEASSRTLPLMALLFLPIVLGMGSSIPGPHADLVQQDEVLRHKAIYLNTGVLPGARPGVLRRLDHARVDAVAPGPAGRTKGTRASTSASST